MTELNREELQFGNYKCPTGNPLWFVAEGYARCWHSLDDLGVVWKFGDHDTARFISSGYWTSSFPFSRMNRVAFYSVEEQLAFIQADIACENRVGTVPQPLGPSLAEWRVLQSQGAAL